MKIFLKILEKLKKPSGYSNPEELDPLFCRYNKGWNDAIAKVEKLLCSYNVSNMWIPVSERLPEDGTYIATLAGELIGQVKPFTGMCGIENGKWDDEDCVIAWMPLPEPYKEKKR